MLAADRDDLGGGRLGTGQGLGDAGARWPAATRTTTVSGTSRAVPRPVTVRVRMPARLTGQTVMRRAAKISSVAFDRFSV